MNYPKLCVRIQWANPMANPITQITQIEPKVLDSSASPW